MRRLGATGRPALIALQLSAGVACLLGTFAWATGYVSELAEPARVTAGPAAPKAVAVARLDDWPEIRNGVPDLKRADPARPPGSEARPPIEALSGEAPARRGDAPVPAGEAPASAREASRSEPRSTSSAQLPAGAVPSPGAGTRESVADAPRRPLAGLSAPTEQGEVDGAAALPAPAAPSRPPDAGETQARREEPAVPRRDVREGQQPPGSLQARPSAAQREPGKATKKAETKPPRSERKRTAAAEPTPAVEDGVATPPPQSEAKPEADGEPVRVLGMSLPTGRKIKECLLELRC
jgi:hypothetical protein